MLDATCVLALLLREPGAAVVAVAFDEDQALTAGLLRATTRALGLSAADRACLALARVRELPALTADRAWVAVADASVALIR